MNKIKKRYLFFISQDYSFPVLRPLQQEILRRGDEVKWFLYGYEISFDFLHADEERLIEIQDVVDYKPDAVFVPGNVVPSFIPGLKVEVFHGLPSTKAKKSGQLYHYIIREMFDLYCTQGPSSTGKFKELAKQYGSFHVEETGWCKLDPLFPVKSSENSSEKKSIFFASTFSPRFSKAKVLYPLMLEMMKKHDFNWYITLHPKMDSEIVGMYKSINLPNVNFVESTELIESFKKSDLMLCDTSSIIYEFLTQLKPVITFQTEKNEPALINVEEIDTLEETILSVLDSLDTNQENIKKSVDQFHPYIDGKSSLRVLDAVDRMLEGSNLPRKKKPLNLLRNFKLRKELGYWKF
ncbi:MAG: UDP-N-acetylglucosamine 2-epimerase [Campylobacterota bacterium]